MHLPEEDRILYEEKLIQLKETGIIDIYLIYLAKIIHCKVNYIKKQDIYKLIIDQDVREEFLEEYNRNHREQFHIKNDTRPLLKFQIINSSNNHVAKHHDVIDVTVPIIWKNHNEYKKQNILMHYCKDCDLYFDFKNSFTKQLKQYGISYQSVVAQILDEKHDPFLFANTNEFSEQSILHMMGYIVGKTNGLATNKRQNIIKQVIDLNILSVSEVKNIIEFNIRFIGKKMDMNMQKNVG